MLIKILNEVRSNIESFTDHAPVLEPQVMLKEMCIKAQFHPCVKPSGGDYFDKTHSLVMYPVHLSCIVAICIKCACSQIEH